MLKNETYILNGKKVDVLGTRKTDIEPFFPVVDVCNIKINGKVYSVIADELEKAICNGNNCLTFVWD